MKIFIYASYPTCGIGYARIANRIASSMVDNGHTVLYFGITNFDPVDRPVNPKFLLVDVSKEETRRKSVDPSYPDRHFRGYGDLFVHEYIESFKPDLIWVYNDTMVVRDVLQAITLQNPLSFKPAIYIYLDLVYEFQTYEPLKYCVDTADCVLLFSECWLKHLVDDLGFPRHKFRVLRHGVDPTIQKMDVAACRRHFGLPQNDFLVLNSNRNSPRKRIETTILAFIQFCKAQSWNPRLKLVLNTKDKAAAGAMTVNIVESIQDACRIALVKYEDVNGRVIQIRQQPNLSDEEMCMLYNACDVGINTCNGEGVGLCNLEHAALGKPQVVPLVGGLRDIFGEYSREYVLDAGTGYMISTSIESNGGLARIHDSLEYAKALSRIFLNHQQASDEFEGRSLGLMQKYHWPSILHQLETWLGVHAKIRGLNAVRVFLSDDQLEKLWPLHQDDSYMAYYVLGPGGQVGQVTRVATIQDVLKRHHSDDALVITKPNQVLPFGQDHRKELYVYKYFHVQFIQNKVRFLTDGLVTTVGEYRKLGDKIWNEEMVFYKGGGIMV